MHCKLSFNYSACMLQKIHRKFSYPGDMLAFALWKLKIQTKYNLRNLISPSTCNLFCRTALKLHTASIHCDRHNHLEMSWIRIFHGLMQSSSSAADRAAGLSCNEGVLSSGS